MPKKDEPNIVDVLTGVVIGFVLAIGLLSIVVYAADADDTSVTFIDDDISDMSIFLCPDCSAERIERKIHRGEKPSGPSLSTRTGLRR